MNTNTLFIGLIAFAIGAGGGYLIGNKSAESHVIPDGSQTHGSMQGEMDSMMVGLEGKTGDQFDKAFLAEMIVHHEGAVEMAEAALRDAKHAELKQMAEAIINAQTGEIAQMKEWQESWYGIE